MSRELKVEIVGSAEGLSKAFKQASDQSSRFGDTLKGLGKAAVLGLGAAGVGGAILGLKVGFDEFTEGQKVAAQTAAVLKSTGGAAKVTAKEVENLAAAISRKTGVDDEAIQSGQNLLLTFTNVQNRVGAGNDIFTKATQTITDMSVALGQDMSSSAVQLGKALNDPIQGISALSRVGVSFTEAQKTSIAAMVEHGNVAGAQKVILAELSKEFGGSAEAAGNTFSGQINKAKNAVEGLAGDLVGKAMPALTTLASSVATDVIPKIQDFAGKLADKLGPALSSIVDFMKDSWPTVKNLFKILHDFWDETFLPIVKSLGKIFKDTVKAITDVVNDNLPAIKQIWKGLSEVIDNLAAVVIPLLDVAFTKVLPAAINILIPIIAGLVTAIAKVTTGIRAIVKGAAGLWEWAKRNAAALGAALSAPFNTIADAVRAVIRTVDSLIGKVQWLLDQIPNIPSLPSIPGKGGGVPFVPGIATGGIVTRPMLAMVGEAGPEAVIPLSRLGRGGGSVHIHIHGPVLGSNPQQVARELARLVEPELNRGRASITTH